MMIHFSLKALTNERNVNRKRSPIWYPRIGLWNIWLMSAGSNERKKLFWTFQRKANSVSAKHPYYWMDQIENESNNKEILIKWRNHYANNRKRSVRVGECIAWSHDMIIGCHGSWISIHTIQRLGTNNSRFEYLSYYSWIRCFVLRRQIRCADNGI